MTNLRKFLFAGTILSLSVTPALGQDYTVTTNPRVTAHVGEIDPQAQHRYHERMRSAVLIADPARRDAAIASARRQLALDTRKPLAAGTIAELDGLLDIGGVSPQLGASG